jgi:hypothetical protein
MTDNLCKEILISDFYGAPEAPKSKYKFSREWLVAEFDYRKYDEVRMWCREYFGPEPRYPDAWTRWEHRYENKIHFRDQADYILFVLRWS